jgi:predicted DNA-binding protein (UPF0251 family)
MARPKKWRQVSQTPPARYFKPTGVSLRALDVVRLNIEEVDALRLKHIEGLSQKQCAEAMHVSRATLQRVLNSAHRKVAEALSLGKALAIEGGNSALAQQPFKCIGDGHEWSVSFQVLTPGRLPACPECEGTAVMRIDPPPSRRASTRRGTARRASVTPVERAESAH